MWTGAASGLVLALQRHFAVVKWSSHVGARESVWSERVRPAYPCVSRIRVLHGSPRRAASGPVVRFVYVSSFRWAHAGTHYTTTHAREMRAGETRETGESMVQRNRGSNNGPMPINGQCSSITRRGSGVASLANSQHSARRFGRFHLEGPASKYYGRLPVPRDRLLPRPLPRPLPIDPVVIKSLSVAFVHMASEAYCACTGEVSSARSASRASPSMC